ncbi:glia-derived nexin-like [Armigeres subalbatus]|uniref:glia-derived nexin-like n=1 Tax=Armigeres subalbatus TaxID=124917 RepID=UPI002ED16C18
MTRLLLTLGVITFATLAFSSSDPPLFSSEFIWDYLEGSFDQRRNLALLPFSIRLGMTMLANTVSDRYTLKQMIEKLHLPNSITRATERHRRKLTQLQLDKHFTYATKIIVFGTDSLNQKLLQTAENFNASIDHHPKLDLKVIPSVVNRWAKNVTSGMTSAVLMSNDLLPDTRMILLSVASFACKWEHQFNVNSSKMDMFNAYPIGKLFMTNFMNLGPTLLPVTLNNDLNIQAIELPFEKDSDYSFMIIMPRQTDGNMTEMVERLNNGAFRHLYDSLVPMRISVKMPRFTISTSVNVNSVLRRLQLTAPFQWSTFQIFKNEKLTLDKVKQSVTVQVDEKGVRAAAVSKFSIVGRSVPMSFNVDRPFVFAILKQSVRFPLFVGHYAYPTKTPPIRP